jgi:Kef-type K+ transport system membrane component KefB
VSTVLVPIFFVSDGTEGRSAIFARVDILGLRVLTLAAIVGKQIVRLAWSERGRKSRGHRLGMIPRGEVGLIFAGIGRR